MSTGIIHILNRAENGDTTIKVEYKSYPNDPYAYLNVMRDISVILNKYYNKRRIKKYFQVVVNRKGYYYGTLGTKEISPIKAHPVNNNGDFIYYNKIVFA